MTRISSFSERPRSHSPRRLADWINPTGSIKVHSLVDKIYKKKNLVLAWNLVKRNKGAGGIDGQTIETFDLNHHNYLDLLYEELKSDKYNPLPVRQKLIPKAGQPGKMRPLGIPTIYDRVCQQAVLNRLEPIFEPIFDDASFGYRPGRSTKDALRKIWKEVHEGNEWIVDADLKNYFGTVDHEKLITLVAQKVSDGRVLKLIRKMLKAGLKSDGKFQSTEEGTPQGGVVSPMLSNILLTPFDREMRSKGYRLTRYADDWVVTCRTREEAQVALRVAHGILKTLGVTLNTDKTRIVHIKWGFEFLGFKIKKGTRSLNLSQRKIRSGAYTGALYAVPKEKSVQKFKDEIRHRTRRRVGKSTEDLIQYVNPVIRGWGNYFCKAHVRRLFNKLDRWIVRRIWSHRCKRWRNAGWRTLPDSKLYGDYKLVNLISLIPSIRSG